MEIKFTQKQDKFFFTIFDEEIYEKEGKLRVSNNQYNEFYFFGGFGSGKSRIVSMAVHIICLNYPNAHGLYIRETYPELKDSVIPQYLAYYPPHENCYKYKESDRTAIYTNGTRLDFRAFDRDTKILSNEYDFIVFSQLEESNEELFLQSLGRNRRKIGGLPKNLLIAEGNPSSNWVKRRLKDKPLNDDMFLIEARTKDNNFLPPDYEVKLRANYPAFWCARYLDGEWSNLDEMVFSEFRVMTNITEPVSRETFSLYKIKQGLDYGWKNPTAIVWGFVDYDSNITIFDEWGDSQQTCDMIALQAKRHGNFPIIADYSIKAAQRDGRSIWQDLIAENLQLTECNKQELENITLVNRLLKSGRLKITKNCVQLLTEINNYKWKKLKLGDNKNLPEEPVDKDNHFIDAMMYLVANIERSKVESPEAKAYKQSLAYHTKIQRPTNNNLNTYS